MLSVVRLPTQLVDRFAVSLVSAVRGESPAWSGISRWSSALTVTVCPLLLRWCHSSHSLISGVTWNRKPVLVVTNRLSGVHIKWVC